MIWKRIKKSSGEQEEKFKEMMTEEKVSFKEKLAMVLSGYLVQTFGRIFVIFS